MKNNFLKEIYIIAIALLALAVVLIVRYSIIPADEERIILDSGDIMIKDDKGGIIISEDGGLDEKKIVSGFVKFESEKEYKDYISESSAYGSFGGGVVQTMGLEGKGMADEAVAPERASETNVQVVGIDEPDIVKTNGKEIYFSPEMRYYIQRGVGIMMEKIMPTPDYSNPKIRVIKAFPAEKISKQSEIDKNGNLLLSGSVLAVFENQTVYGYDVSAPDSPKEKWSVKLGNNSQIVQARLYKDKIYLVTSSYADKYGPCPIPLFETGKEKISVSCLDVYHPKVRIPAGATYHISVIDISSGSVKKGVSFVGSYGSVVYMSENAIYVSYSYNGDMIKFFHEFFIKNNDLVPSDIITRMTKLREYDISESAKMAEFNVVMSDLLASLGKDEGLKIENELTNRMKDYLKDRKRDLQKTDIVKIGVGDLTVDALGIISGSLLNQFSLDEYNGNLRIATTVNGGGIWYFGGNAENENDIYVLDKNMQIVGSIKGLGIDERIYSARFIEDKGYLVTFKQIDPFFVLDLSDPKNPQVKGELKIPGYSSYLHPITKDKILGVGMDNSQVKISLFDVSSPENPKEISKYALNEYWTDVMNTHHAFLLDDKHKVFFMPGGKGGYVFSYENNDLKLMKAVAEIQARRALYINDYLYIIGEDKIVVLNENTWERVSELDF